mgnify:CR=1 FL=1
METLEFKIKPVKDVNGMPIYRAYKLSQLFDLGKRYVSIWRSTIKEVITIPNEEYAPLEMIIEPFIITHLGEYIFITCRYDDDCIRAFISPKYKRDEMRELAQYARSSNVLLK